MESVLRPLLYSGRELSGSGDLVLVDRDCRILMPLKFPLPDGAAAKVLNTGAQRSLQGLLQKVRKGSFWPTTIAGSLCWLRIGMSRLPLSRVGDL